MTRQGGWDWRRSEEEGASISTSCSGHSCLRKEDGSNDATQIADVTSLADFRRWCLVLQKVWTQWPRNALMYNYMAVCRTEDLIYFQMAFCTESILKHAKEAKCIWPQRITDLTLANGAAITPSLQSQQVQSKTTYIMVSTMSSSPLLHISCHFRCFL